MKELSLQEIKQVELEILKEFHSFCEENNIRYFLAFGTLLGAIRYKGFIPWDDDVDVLVPRDDYNRLLKQFQNNDKYCLYAFERDKKYSFPFAKLCDMTTRLVETVYPNNGVELGVNIDIFPLDHFDDDLGKAKKEVKRISRNLIWLGATKLDAPLTKHPIKRFVWHFILIYVKLRGSAHYVRKVIKECNKPEQNGSRYMGPKVWPIWGERIIVPAEVFADTVQIEFEGMRLPAPADYDTLLTCLYGDYLPEPPVEKRKTHHSFKAYRL